MSAAFRYWTLIGIDAAGGRKSSEIAPAKAFFREELAEFVALGNVPDLPVQRLLLQKSQGEKLPGKLNLAEVCLRCFISTQIELTCIQLEAKFSQNYGFNRYDLFPFVLNDVLSGFPVAQYHQPSTSFTPLAIKILQTFNPDRGSLSTWTNRLVKHDYDLNHFLLERGVYLISDWALLNDTTSSQLQKIFKEFYQLTAPEIKAGSILLESYRAVYCRDRLQQNQTSFKKLCPPPSTEQLQEISGEFHRQTNQILAASEVLAKLQDMAELLRQYRIYLKGGIVPTESLDRRLEAESQASYLVEQLTYQKIDEDAEGEVEFLQFYREQFISSLDKALEQVLHSRIAYLQRKSPEKAQQFMMGLRLFYCDRLPMAEIARRVGLQEQYQISRLLKLNEFRTDVQQLLLKFLLETILEKAHNYTDSQNLKKMSEQIEKALDEQIEEVISKAQNESANPRKTQRSLFTERLCFFLSSVKVGTD